MQEYGFGTITSDDTINTYDFDNKHGVMIAYKIDPDSRRINGYCSHAQPMSGANQNMWLGVGNSYIYWLDILDDLGLTSIEQFKNWLDTQNVVCTYKLNTPIEHQLTPTQLKTLRGTNNIWSNSNGNITVRFWRH